MSSSSRRPRKEAWRNAERHYCAVCNAWMGSDRQSIMLHENGKKHLENHEKAMQMKRNEKQKEEKQQKLLQSSLQQMEQAALQSHLQQDTLVASSILAPSMNPSSFQLSLPPSVVSSTPSVPPKPTTTTTLQKSTKEEKEKWKKRRKERESETKDVNDEPKTNKRRKIQPDEGHYEYDGKIFLEGPIFGEILEEDMPVQLWTGPQSANWQEKRLPERDLYWKNALVVAVRNEKLHVSYLASPNDTDETVEKNVSFDRIRIILGADESIPDTLEEARLLAMGGEEIKVEPSKCTAVDETTGLSGWSTVAIKRTTVRQEVKEERGRLREKKKQALVEQEAKEREAEARKLEEIKAANADDSALGSIYFAELGREVRGYKGVDISDTGDDKLTIADTAKSLSSGKTSVSFKKKIKKPMNNRSRRTTSADDD